MFFLFFGGIFAYVLYQFLTSFPPGRKRREEEFKNLKAEIADWFPELIAWNKDELEMLSLNQINNKKSGTLRPTGKGIFTSVYSEPMIAYAYKQLQGKKGQSLVYAKTANHEYGLNMKSRETDIWMDGIPLGSLKSTGAFIDPNGQEIARIKKSNDQKSLPVFIKDREIASLIHPDQLKDVNPRTFELVQQMSKEEEAVIVALAINQMVKSEIRQ